jgi:hypothetical protein
MPMRLTTSGAFILALAASSIPATAQQLPKQNVLSIQPIGVVLAVYAGEYERATSATTTFGIGATSWSGFDEDDFDAWSADVKFRYYPEAKPFENFSFGILGGLARVEDASCSQDPEVGFFCRTEQKTAPTFGFLIDYNWLLGPTNSFYVGVGLGAKRVLNIDDEDEFFDFPNAYPTARLSVGIAF